MTLRSAVFASFLFTVLATGCASSIRQDSVRVQHEATDPELTKPAGPDTGMRIALTSVFVDNPVKAHEFYTEVLGFQSKEFNPAALLAIVVSPEDPDGTALLLEPRGASFAKTYQEAVFNAGLPIIIFGVDDLASTIERLQAKGVQFRDDLTRKEWGLENMFEDTFGNLIMLQETE